MFLSDEEIKKIGFKSVGKDCRISDKAVFYSPETMSIGDHSRIDDFVIITAPIQIGRYVHIGCHTTILGQGTIILDNYSGLSGKVSVYSSSDNYDGTYMTNPCIPEPYRQTYHKDIYFGEHVVVGTGSVVLPGSYLPIGCAIGAMSLVNQWFEPYSIIAGIPGKVIGRRKQNIIELERQLENKDKKS